MSRRPVSVRRADHGQADLTQSGVITAMVVIFAICLLLTIVAVTDLSAAYLRRQGTRSLADGAALAATGAAAAGSIYQDGDGRYVPIDQDAAAVAVRRYLGRIGAYRDYPGLQARVQVLGHRVLVTLSVPYRLPIPFPGVDPTTTVHATSAAGLPIYQ